MPINVVGGCGLSFLGCDVTFDRYLHSELSKVPRYNGDAELLLFHP